jgi:hypothetical protein
MTECHKPSPICLKKIQASFSTKDFHETEVFQIHINKVFGYLFAVLAFNNQICILLEFIMSGQLERELYTRVRFCDPHIPLANNISQQVNQEKKLTSHTFFMPFRKYFSPMKSSKKR